MKDKAKSMWNLVLLLDFLALMSNSQSPKVAQGLEDHMSSKNRRDGCRITALIQVQI
jgi:hypothetical protein